MQVHLSNLIAAQSVRPAQAQPAQRTEAAAPQTSAPPEPKRDLAPGLDRAAKAEPNSQAQNQRLLRPGSQIDIRV